MLAEGDLAAVRAAGPFEVPWAVAPLPDGSFLVTERPGRLQHVKSNAETNPVAGVPPVFYVGHGGLLDVAVDPEFEDNHFVYLSYCKATRRPRSSACCARDSDENAEVLTEEQVIFEGSPGPRPEQIGGRIALTGDGYLFILSVIAGTARVRRILPTPPVRSSASEPMARCPKIIRSDWRRVRGRKSGATAIATRKASLSIAPRENYGLDQHGPQGGDELNRIVRGGNYGWPIATFGVDYSGKPIAVNSEQPGTELPVHYWVPISVAPSSLAVETQPATTEIWLGTLAGEMVVQLSLADNCVLRKQRLLRHQLGRIRDVRIDPNGVLYVLTDGGEGMLYRVELPHGEMRGGGKGPFSAIAPIGGGRMLERI